jgi:hypothetical protein
LIEEAAGLEPGSLSLEEDLAAQAVALCEDEEEAGTSYWESEEEEYVDEEEEETCTSHASGASSGNSNNFLPKTITKVGSLNLRQAPSLA